jgi:small subunit ribosomal protein S17
MAVSEQATEKVAAHGNRKVGIVVSAKMAKTIVVEVKRKVAHPLYRRVVTRKSKFYAHDEKSAAQVGDQVSIVECRPISKLKRWRLAEVIWQPQRADAVAAGSAKSKGSAT